MSAHRAKYPVATMCRVLGVSTSGYYSWAKRGPSARVLSDRVLAWKIRAIHLESRGTYGAARVHVELTERQVRVAKKRVARLMRSEGITGVSRRKRVRTTQRNPEALPAPDLVQRDFSAISPDRLWVADITYVPTWQGFLYLAVVMDAFSRRIVGWATAGHMRTELVLDGLNMAVQQRRPVDVVGHSDHGSQYTSLAYGKRCREAGVRPSMGSVGDCYDNAIDVSYFATLECELIDRTAFHTRREARLAVFEFIEGWYNTRRRHSALGYRSPAEFERQRLSAAA